MPHSLAAYLTDIVEACDAINDALSGVDLGTYEQKRLIRSAVEREFILIGEAVVNLKRIDPQVAAGISHARVIVGFRNLLTHDYAAVDDETVFGVAAEDLPLLRSECEALLMRVEGAS